jgi:hypothetical protein
MSLAQRQKQRRLAHAGAAVNPEMASSCHTFCRAGQSCRYFTVTLQVKSAKPIKPITAMISPYEHLMLPVTAPVLMQR